MRLELTPLRDLVSIGIADRGVRSSND